jgi:FtsZ-binding cell division protein ZapB
MNPKKCAFGVSASQFLGFLVHERGIKIGLKSQEAVRTMVAPTMKRELQQLIGKINFVRIFISNLSGRIKPLMNLVKIKADEVFRWGQNNNEHLKKSKNIWQDHLCWFLPSGTGRSTFIC